MLRALSFELSGLSSGLSPLSGEPRALSSRTSAGMARAGIKIGAARVGGAGGAAGAVVDQAAGLGFALPMDLRTLIASRRVSRPSLLPKSFISV